MQEQFFFEFNRQTDKKRKKSLVILYNLENKKNGIKTHWSPVRYFVEKSFISEHTLTRQNLELITITHIITLSRAHISIKYLYSKCKCLGKIILFQFICFTYFI